MHTNQFQWGLQSSDNNITLQLCPMPTYGPSLPHLNPMATGDWKVDEVLPPVSPPWARVPPFRVLHFLFQSPKKKERRKRKEGKCAGCLA